VPTGAPRHGARELERVYRGVAAHEADQGALDIVEAEPAGETLTRQGS